MQIQIRLLKKQSDQGLPCLLLDKHFVNYSLENQHFIVVQKEKSVQNFRTFTVILSSELFFRINHKPYKQNRGLWSKFCVMSYHLFTSDAILCSSHIGMITSSFKLPFSELGQTTIWQQRAYHISKLRLMAANTVPIMLYCIIISGF